MLKRVRLGNWVFAITGTQVEETYGLNSILKDGNHCLMWDFDNATQNEAVLRLDNLQARKQLPTIYLFQSSTIRRHFALCLRRSTFREAIMFASWIDLIDMRWLKACVTRGYFTLRIGLKHGYEPQLVRTLKSVAMETVKISDLVNYDRYQIAS